jgi:hypothetical protein
MFDLSPRSFHFQCTDATHLPLIFPQRSSASVSLVRSVSFV